MKKLIQLSLVASLLVGGLAGSVAVAGTDTSKFPLLKAVPEDVFIAVAGRENSERKFLSEYWDGVYQEFCNQGILTDVYNLLTQGVSDENLDQIDELHDRFADLLKDVDWGGLFGKEMIYTARFGTTMQAGSPYEGLLMGRMTKKEAGENVQAIKAILKELATLIETEAGEGQVVLTEVDMPEVGGPVLMFGPSVMPHVITVGHTDDVIFIAIFNRTLLQDTLGLLKGKSKASSLVSSEKFKKAFADLPDAEDSLVFFDVADLFDKINGMLKVLAGPEPTPPATSGPDAPQQVVVDSMAGLRIVTKLIDDLSIFQHMATVQWTDGYRVYDESITSLKPGAESKSLYKIIAGIKATDDFSKFVPQEAESFSYCSGISFSTLYKEILKFVKKNAPDGEGLVAQLEGFQKDELGLDINKDVLSLFAGPFVSVSMRGGQDWVIMAKVTDEKKMTSQVSSLFEWANGMMGEENALMLTKVDVGSDKKFTQVAHPMMMMMGGMSPPVIGCDQDYVLLGSSTAAVRLCLDTGRGNHPNILKNERWRKEALVPTMSKVDSISFTDQSNMAQELQQLFAGLGMGLGMAGMFAQDAPPEMRSVFAALPPILSKLGIVAGHMNFFQSQAAYSTFNGKAWHTRGVQNYKKSVPKPPPAPKPAPVGDEDEDQDESDEL